MAPVHVIRNIDDDEKVKKLFFLLNFLITKDKSTYFGLAGIEIFLKNVNLFGVINIGNIKIRTICVENTFNLKYAINKHQKKN